VEILRNEPYTDSSGDAGQYTQKIYHIGSHLPGEQAMAVACSSLDFYSKLYFTAYFFSMIAERAFCLITVKALLLIGNVDFKVCYEEQLTMGEGCPM